jgi:hypothetical protein
MAITIRIPALNGHPGNERRECVSGVAPACCALRDNKF